MPWTEKDYPDSMKNMEPMARGKAIDIANAMLAEGHEEGDAIPIAQTPKWAKDATQAEKKELKQKDIADHPYKGKSRGAKLMKSDVNVQKTEEGYEVKTAGATRADSLHDAKKEAVQRAEEIAGNRGTKVKKERLFRSRW